MLDSLKLLMESYLISLGLVAVFFGVILEGEVLFLTGIIFAKTGHLDFAQVIMAGFLGVLVHDGFFFFVGKTQGKAFFDKRPNLHQRLDKITAPFYKNDWIFFLTYRFLIGFRMILLLLFGISDISIKKFLLVSLFGATFWVAIYGGIGYYFTDVIVQNLDWFKEHQTMIFLMAISLLAIYILPKLLAHPSDE